MLIHRSDCLVILFIVIALILRTFWQTLDTYVERFWIVGIEPEFTAGRASSPESYLGSEVRIVGSPEGPPIIIPRIPRQNLIVG